MERSSGWTVGGTPLVELGRLRPFLGGKVRLVAKCEWTNPGGSSKDRAVWRMLEEAAGRLDLVEGKTVLDACGADEAVSYAWIGAAKGYPVTLCMPEPAAAARRRVEGFGARVIGTEPLDGFDGALIRARLLFGEDPAAYWFANQCSNEDNWRAHRDGTGEELWSQSRGRVTHFVSGAGSAGTFVGVGRRLREANPRVKLLLALPDGPAHGIEGWRHLPTAIRLPLLDPALADGQVVVSTAEAEALARELPAACGIEPSLASAANLAAALRVCEEAFARGEEALVATVLPSRASTGRGAI